MVLKRCDRPIQNLPLAGDYGWDIIEGQLNPTMTNNLPAPLSLLELSSCSCKGNCSSNRCKCKKNGFVCTDMCKCVGCINDTNDGDEKDVLAESDLEED